MANDCYEERYCAYIDILGFAQLIGDLAKDPSSFINIQQVLQKVHQPQRIELSEASHSQVDFQAQSISDAVAISTRCTAVGLLSLIVAVEGLARSLLGEGYFTRGAICKGRLYHDDKMVFGEALIAAYRLETEVVRYPRVMLTKAVVDDAMGFNQPVILQHIIQADDGPYFVHVLRSLSRRLESLAAKVPGISADGGISELEFFLRVQGWIEQRFIKSVDAPRHFEKVKWFADYWNRTVDPISAPFVMHIDAPGLSWYNAPIVDHTVRQMALRNGMITARDLSLDINPRLGLYTICPAQPGALS